MQPLLHGAEAGLRSMNPVDWVIAIILAISTVTAFMRGLIRSLVSLAGVVLAILVAFWYAPRASVALGKWIEPHALAQIVAFVGIFAGVYLVSVLVGKLLRGAASAVGLGFFDRLAGAGFGFARGVLLLAAVLLPAAPYLQHVTAAQGSVLIPYLLPAAHGISFVMPRDFGTHFSTGTWLQHAKAATGEFVPTQPVRKAPSE